VNVVSNHKNLVYFGESRLLSQHQAQWLEYLLQFNLSICFYLEWLGTKQNALTQRWDLYLENKDNQFAQANPQNYHLIFSSKQLQPALKAMHLEQPLTRKETILDIEILYSDIKAATLQKPEYAKLLNPT